MILLYIVIFYFFFIRPKSKEESSNRSFFDDLELGDSVVTIGGIHGVVRDITEDDVILALNNQARSPQMKVQKEAISIELSEETYPKEKPEQPEKRKTKLKS